MKYLYGFVSFALK